MREKFYKLCKKVNYSTYIDIRDKSLYGSVGTLAFGLLGAPTGVIFPIELLFLITYFILSFSDGDKYTKNVMEINELYQIFLKNYIELHDMFDIDNPIEIYTMFTYLLNNGYLSKNGENVFDNMHAYDIRSLLGLDVINGVNVCRHRASMLNDILNISGVESRTLSVYLRDNISTIKLTDDGAIDWLEFFSWYSKNMDLIDNKTLNLIDELLHNYSASQLLPIEFQNKFVDTKDKSLKISGNHMITCCSYNDNGYFLDPTQSRIYSVQDRKRKIIGDEFDSGILIRETDFKLFDYKKNRQILKSCLCLPSVSKSVEDELIKKTLKLCRDNLDIFENFYNNNSELYNEIGNKLKKVRKK